MSMEKGRRIVLEEADAAAPVRTPPAERTVLEPAPSEAEAVDAGDPLESAAKRVSGVSRWLPAGLGLGAVLLLLHTFYALATLLRESPLLGVAWSAVFVLVAGGAGRALWRLWRALRGAREHEALRQRARHLLAHHGLCEGRALCEQLAVASGQHGSAVHLRWQQQLQEAHNDREVLQLYGRTVLAEADSRALATVSRHAGDVAVMVAMSYFPAIDMLLVLWRQLKLVEEVSSAYGVDPGYWGRIRLLRNVLRNMALAGAAEVATEVGVEVLGAGVMAKLSAAVAQGVAAGVLTARLGLRTMDACRAIAWEEGERPMLRQVTGGVLASVKRHLLAAPPGD